MTALPQSAFNGEISSRLTAPLREVVRRRWVVEAAVGFFKTLIAGLITLLAATLLLGYFQNLGMAIRVFLALVTWAVVIRSAIKFFRPAFRRWSLSRAAMHVELDRPEIHERLSSAVELAGQTDQAFRGSPGLLAHLFHQAEADASAVLPGQVVPTVRVLRWALLLAPVLIAWATLALVPATTPHTLAGLYRVLLPWRSTLPPMLTQVLVKPGDDTVAQGDAMDITAHFSFDTDARHTSLIRKFSTGEMLTDAMTQTGSADFSFHLDNLKQSFSYKVSSDQGDSEWFTATVHPRPKMIGLEIRCDYPAYTALAPSVTNDTDGAIQAIVGTQATLTIRTAAPIAGENNQIVMNGGAPNQSTLPLKQLQAGGTVYQAQFTVTRSGDYRINLTNEFGLTNKDEPARNIVAVPDEAPTVVISSPQLEVTVGAEDTVPVKYIAKDDFGIVKIEALIQVDDRPVRTVPIAFSTVDKRSVRGSPFNISVADVLKTEGISNARTIRYQLKATDNRDPDPQVGLSDRQTLTIDLRQYQNFQVREDAKTAKDLKDAIQVAIDQLGREQRRIEPARDTDPRQSLDGDRPKQLHLAAQKLPGTSKDLAQAADEAMDSVFQTIAKQVKEIADGPIRSAADDAADADLNVDKGQERHDAAARSLTEIAQAKTALQKLVDSQAIDKQLQQAEAARELADAAQKQQEAADLMKSPQQLQQQPRDRQAEQQQQQALRRQEQAQRRLQDALNQTEALRDPQAQETAQKLQELIRKVEEAEQHQEAAAQQTEKQKDAEHIQQDANAIAQQQEALNKEIQKSAEQNKQALQKANANPPSADQQQNIVRALDKNQIQQAHDQMQQSARQLHDAAQHLQDQARSNDLHPTQKQQDALNKDQKAEDAAQKQADAAQKAANELKQAPARPNPTENPPADPENPATADAKHTAEQIEKQAAELHPQNDQAKQDADAAEQHARAAEHAAEQAANAADPQEAQKDQNQAATELNQAAHDLAQAAKQNADAHKGEMVQAQQKNAQAAAEQTAQEARKQDALAQAVATQQNALAQVQNPPQPDQTAQQQNEITEQTRDAKKQAEQLQQQAHQANNPNVEARAKQANADLAAAQEHAAHAAQGQQQATQHQQEAANANNAQQARAAEQNANHDLQQAAEQQHDAEQALTKAEGELRDMPGHEEDAAQGQATAAQQAAQAAQEAAQAQQEASQQQNPQAAQQAAHALTHAAQELARATPGLEPGQPENNPQPENDPAMQPSPTAGRTTESREGIMMAGLPITLPASVLDLGITADQWAVLPPLVKKDLMNAAQQSGPPAYRQMMREYFAKIAKMPQVQ